MAEDVASFQKHIPATSCVGPKKQILPWCETKFICREILIEVIRYASIWLLSLLTFHSDQNILLSATRISSH